MDRERHDEGCAAVRPLFQAWTRDDLDDERRQEVRRHVLTCTACRTELLAVDASALFLQMRSRALPPEFWREFDAGLRARLAAAKPGLSGRLAGWIEMTRVPRLAYVTIPAAMVLLVAGTLMLTQRGSMHPGAHSPRTAGGIPIPFERPPAGPRPADLSPRFEETGVALSSLQATGRPADPPALEEVGSPSARVYRFEGSAGDPTPIYMVVDETIDF